MSIQQDVKKDKPGLVALVRDDDVLIRAFTSDACLHRAYKWAHWKYCLGEQGFKPWQLPPYLRVELIMVRSIRQFVIDYCVLPENVDLTQQLELPIK